MRIAEKKKSQITALYEQCSNLPADVRSCLENGYFTVTVANQPDASANRGNGGRGPILWWGRAAHWQFADGVCSVFDSEQKHTEEELVMSFRVLEKEAA